MEIWGTVENIVLAYVVGMGAVVGSFLNVVIARLPEEQSVVHPRSRCPQCKRAIAWYDNIPILSWLWLRARCRHCELPIPSRYPLVELLTALLWGAIYLRFGLAWPLAVWLPLSAALLAITFLDIDHWWIPDIITAPMAVWTLAWAGAPGNLGYAAAAIGLAPAALLWSIAWGFERITGREGMGLGDVKLLAVLGLAVGAVPALSVLFLASAQGAVVGVIVAIAGGHRGVDGSGEAEDIEPAPEPDPQGDDWTPPPRAIPFGPFLVLATLEWLLLPHIFGPMLANLSTALLGMLGG